MIAIGDHPRESPKSPARLTVSLSARWANFAAVHESAFGTDFQLLHCTKSRRDPGTADMTDGLSGLNSGAHDPISDIRVEATARPDPAPPKRALAG
jgi:hypothetical protein